MVGRLEEDHRNAALLARGLVRIAGIKIDPERVQTNILIFDVFGTGMNTAEFSAKLKAGGVLANGINPRQMRMVTHKDVSRHDCETALGVIRDAVEPRT
jgi:threonine aldolase